MMIRLLALKEVYLSNEEGATVVEYSLIVAGISLAIATIVFSFGDTIAGLFEDNAVEQQVAN